MEERVRLSRGEFVSKRRAEMKGRPPKQIFRIQYGKKKRKKHKKTKKSKIRRVVPMYNSNVTIAQHDKYIRYLSSDSWRQKRNDALIFYGENCGVCGSKFNLQVHHRNYKNLYRETMSDLMILCRHCHCDAHGIKMAA